MKQIRYALLLITALSSCRGNDLTTQPIESKPILDSPKYTIPEELRDQLEKSEFYINTKKESHDFKNQIPST